MKKLEESIAQETGHVFTDKSLLKQALTHPAYERLEFLGDRVLNVVMADTLFHLFPKESEGALAKRHAYLVSAKVLTQIAKKLDFTVRAKIRTDSILADAMEAVIGALYLDAGLPTAEKWIKALWNEEIAKDKTPPSDFKSELQEHLQGNGHPLPQYKTLNTEGPDHHPVFTVEVTAGDKKAEGKGPSKREAEQASAKELLKIMNGKC